ncbi:MAG: EAL domain-containing protein [Deltaproteobacteria bacterium]|nr:EAL domain-containing protein [Deltaproteobacteria bacterium]
MADARSMATATPIEGESPTRRKTLPDFAEVFDAVDARFEHNGVVGVLVVDASFVRGVEQRHGGEARRRALERLGLVLRELAQERLDVDDLVVFGDPGRCEILVLLFRENRGARFYRQELPGFDSALRGALKRDGAKSFYPYLRRPPEVETGIAVSIRNPRFSTESQVWRAVEEARGDAELNARLRARELRQRFTEIVLDRSIISVYEPIVDVNSKTVFGYEALARGPENSGFHSAGEIFPAAEREDMVFELDCLCRESGLRGAVGLPSGTKLFLNVMPTAIHDPSFRADRLIKTLEECELSPSDVVFEVSEQESIDNFSLFRETRDYYRSLGFQFALDDTGSGYAGLEALLEISPEFIKMDRNFVSGVDQDPARQDLLAALLTVAERTGARIVGEGLDTLEELDMLEELGIHFGQGWLFGHPTPLRASR